MRARATIAPGREWLAQDFLPDVLKERAGPDLIVHGPVILDYDELARLRFARTTSPATRTKPTYPRCANACRASSRACATEWRARSAAPRCTSCSPAGSTRASILGGGASSARACKSFGTVS
jgi:hypothetical protein